MTTKIEKDPITGRNTTGHEWDGIKELNTPLPKWWLYTFYACIVYAVIWWLLYPSWPYVTGYFGGIIGSNQRIALDQRVAEAEAGRAQYLERIHNASPAAIAGDPELLSFALAGGEAAFSDNCAPCHALGGAGQGPYPALGDDEWIWGGSFEDIQTTINYGIRSDHDETRFNEMPAFGRDEILESDEIEAITQYILSLSDPTADAKVTGQGNTLYEEQCVACHGEQGEGIAELGAPNLADQIWLYGETPEQIAEQIINPRHGVMPPWIGRLDQETIKILTVYVHSLGGGQ